MRLRQLLAIFTLGAFAMASPLPGAVPISAGEVVAAIRARGFSLAEDQVHVLAPIVAARPHPGLQLVSVEPWQKSGAAMRLECRTRGECLPFYVMVSWADAASAEATVSRAKALGLSKFSSSASAASFVVRSGQPVKLVMEGERIHIEVTVICLENGGLGDRIRAASPDHSTIYAAEVAGARLLKGRI